MPFLSVLGHTNIDVQCKVEALPAAGKSAPVLDRRTVYGGTACNIARHAATLGVPTRLWSRVGPDMPADWRAALAADGVELLLESVDGDRTPTCFIFTDLVDQQAYAMDQGAMTPPYTVPETAWQDTRWLHVGTGDPGSYLPAVDAARKAGIKIGFDPGQEIHFAYDTKSFEALLDRCDVFFANDAEMEVALRFLRYGDPVQLLDHTDTVVATHGANGATLLQAGKAPVHVAAADVTVVDPTGAGDALRAGWYYGLWEGLEPPSALGKGVRAAGQAVGFEGPQGGRVTA